MKDIPSVSIVIPTHKRPQLLPRAIDSVLAQTFTEFEVIIVDDDPAGSAEPIVRAYTDARVRYLKNEGVHGGSAARNAGIRAARAEYIAFLDDDDMWVPEKLETQTVAFSNVPSDVGFCVTGVRAVSEKGEVLTHVEEGVHDFSEIALARFKGFLTITLFIRKSVFEDVGLFDEEMPSHQEAELIIRVTRKYRGLGIDKPLAIANMFKHEQIGGNIFRRIQGRQLVLEKHAGLYATRPEALAKHYFWLGLQYRTVRHMATARSYFWKAFLRARKPRYVAHALYVSLLGLFRTVPTDT